MREIKFQAICKGEKILRDVTAIDFYGQNVSIEIAGCREWHPYKILRQFTGLKDKDGKEIYEGDIIRVDGTIGYENCKPKPKKNEYVGIFRIEIQINNWGLTSHWVNIKGYKCSTHIMGNTEGNAERVEVIGNIYENPELLKG